MNDDVLQNYSGAFQKINAYDKKLLTKPEGSKACYKLTIEDAKDIIKRMQGLCEQGNLFGIDTKNSLDTCISAIYQTFDGKELYPSLEEKAAVLLYFIIKDHPFIDGNKRIAAGLFVSFLQENGRLNREIINDRMLEIMTIWIAESMPSNMEQLICLIMSDLLGDQT